MQKMKTTLRLLNLFYFLISAAAIACFTLNFIMPDHFPFLRVGITAKLDKENSKEVFTDEMLESYGVSRDDLFSTPVEVEAKVDVKNEMLLNVWKANDPVDYIDNEFINPNIDKVVEQIEPVFKEVAEKAAKSSIKSQIENMNGSQTFYSDLMENGHGELNSETLANDVDTIYNALTAEGATLDSVNTVYNEIYNKYSDALGNGTQTPEESKTELEEILAKYDLVDEEGNITDIDDAIAALLEDLLSEKDGNESEPAPIGFRKLLNPNYEEEAENKENPIAEQLKKFVADKLPKEETALGFKIAGICLAVFVLGWAIKFIQCIICLFRKTPYLRVELIGIISGIVQVVLAFVSGLLLLAFKFEFIDTMKNLPFVGGIISSIPLIGKDGIGVELTFSALIPGILVVVNFVYSIIYGFAKRSFKRSY